MKKITKYILGYQSKKIKSMERLATVYRNEAILEIAWTFKHRWKC